MISMRILSSLGMIFNAKDHRVVVNGSWRRETAVSVSRNIFLFVKLRYSRIVFKWFILTSSETALLIFSYRLFSSFLIISSSMLLIPFWKLSVMFSTKTLKIWSSLSFRISFLFFNIPKIRRQKSYCVRFSKKFLVSSGWVFVFCAVSMKNESNKLSANSNISELKPEVCPIIQLQVLKAISMS